MAGTLSERLEAAVKTAELGRIAAAIVAGDSGASAPGRLSDLKRLLREAAGYVLLAAYTGIRRGHLLRLTRHDVEGDFIRLDRSSKTGTLQMVPLHPKVREIAKRLPLGISDRPLRESWDKARKAAGIECRWHDLRHTCASWLVQAGVPIYTVAQMLGHSSTAVTQRYAHLAPQHLAEAVAKLA